MYFVHVCWNGSVSYQTPREAKASKWRSLTRKCSYCTLVSVSARRVTRRRADIEFQSVAFVGLDGGRTRSFTFARGCVYEADGRGDGRVQTEKRKRSEKKKRQKRFRVSTRILLPSFVVFLKWQHVDDSTWVFISMHEFSMCCGAEEASSLCNEKVSAVLCVTRRWVLISMRWDGWRRQRSDACEPCLFGVRYCTSTVPSEEMDGWWGCEMKKKRNF